MKDENYNIFWHGFVEDVDDPLKMGRCRVRIFGLHSENKEEIPTNELPWAKPLMPYNSASSSGVGYSPTGILPGTWVVGFFQDGSDCQEPVILGTYGGINKPPEKEDFIAPKDSSLGFNDPSGKFPRKNYLNQPDTNKLARNEDIANTIVEKKRKDLDTDNPTALGGGWSEPSTPYKAVYPKNHVLESESGHIFEVDDTPGAERLHRYHRSGTFEEIHPDGSVVEKIIGNDYVIIRKNNHISVYGNMTINVGNDVKIASGKNIDIQVGGDARLYVGKNLSAKVAGNTKIETGGNTSMQTGGNFTHFVGGSYTVISGGLMTLLGPKVSLNPGVGFSPSGVGFSLGLSPNTSKPAPTVNTSDVNKVKLELDDGSEVEMEENREVQTSNRGWVKAKDLSESDNIASLAPKSLAAIPIPKEEISQIKNALGSFQIPTQKIGKSIETFASQGIGQAQVMNMTTDFVKNGFQPNQITDLVNNSVSLQIPQQNINGLVDKLVTKGLNPQQVTDLMNTMSKANIGSEEVFDTIDSITTANIPQGELCSFLDELRTAGMNQLVSVAEKYGITEKLDTLKNIEKTARQKIANTQNELTRKIKDSIPQIPQVPQLQLPKDLNSIRIGKNGPYTPKAKC